MHIIFCPSDISHSNPNTFPPLSILNANRWHAQQSLAKHRQRAAHGLVTLGCADRLKVRSTHGLLVGYFPTSVSKKSTSPSQTKLRTGIAVQGSSVEHISAATLGVALQALTRLILGGSRHGDGSANESENGKELHLDWILVMCYCGDVVDVEYDELTCRHRCDRITKPSTVKQRHGNYLYPPIRSDP